MLEKDIENLIAAHPEEFFPGEGFTLIGQQYEIHRRRIDILFEDRHKRRIIVEVKRGILTREASGQIAEYYGLLKSEEPQNVYELVLCANVIPKERRIFLETIGVDCKELGLASISEMADKYGYRFLDDQDRAVEEKLAEVSGASGAFSHVEPSVWIFQGNPTRYDVLNALADPVVGNRMHWLVNQHRSKIKAGHLGLIWMSGPASGIYAVTRIETDPGMMAEDPAEKQYWTGEDGPDQAIRVRMTVLKRLINKPVLKTNILGIDGLSGLSILRNWQQTNYPVSAGEWDLLSRLL